MKKGSSVAITFLAVLLSGCGRRIGQPPAVSVPSADRVGLTADEREMFYHLAEGSEVFPLDWFLALENEDGTGMFADRLERFGFIPDPPGPRNPHGLPVGITGAETRDLRFAGIEMVGVNCAACHVSQIRYNGKNYRLDGAGGRVDLSAFYGGLGRATVQTASDPLRFLRFVARLPNSGSRTAGVSSSNPSLFELRPETQYTLRETLPDHKNSSDMQREIVTALQEENRREPINLQEDIPLTAAQNPEKRTQELQVKLTRDTARYAKQPRGHALGTTNRFEAITPLNHSYIALVPSTITDTIAQFRLFKARIQFLIRIAKSLQAPPVTPGFGRLDAFGGARNLLFAVPRPATAPVSYPHLWNFERLTWVHWDGNTTSILERNIGQALGVGAVLDAGTMSSTVSLGNLHTLEILARKIRPPRWQEVFGPIDHVAAARGQTLFKEYCAKCHDGDPNDAAHLIDTTVVGTDPNRAVNFAEPIGTQPNEEAIAELMSKVKEKAYSDMGATQEQRQIFESSRAPQWRATKKYAARPLISVWATAPYLHNNSVPTLYDLLLPPAARPRTFYVGSEEYDAKKLGIVGSQSPGSFLFDASLPGNSNEGHSYGTSLTDAQRSDLLEYLKTF